jgi:K+-sensing histidine kinase KdpD
MTGNGSYLADPDLGWESMRLAGPQTAERVAYPWKYIVMLVEKKYISIRFSQAKLKERHKELAVLHDIASDLTKSLSLTEILDRAILKVRKHFKVDAVRIYLMDESNQHLKLVAHKGISKRHLEGLREMRVGQGFSGMAARTKSFVAQRVSDLENGARAALLHQKGFEVVICVPLIVKEKVVGVLNLAVKRLISLNEKKVDLLLAIGNQIAVAVRVAAMYEDVLNKSAELERKKDELEFFAYAISHDLKNPAIGVAGFARLLTERYGTMLDEKGIQYCQQIRNAAEQIVTFTREINEYIQSAKVCFHVKNTDVKRILKHIREEIAPTLKERGIEWSEPANIPEVMADELAITRVFRNLIDNALKHGGKDLDKIAVGYKEEVDAHIFSFANNGLPMKKGDSSLVFQMFGRLPGAKDTEGSGLGLTIVKEIVEAHNGAVWFESGEKKGTIFYVSLPKEVFVKA